jgi:hypothetical protein
MNKNDNIRLRISFCIFVPRYVDGEIVKIRKAISKGKAWQ